MAATSTVSTATSNLTKVFDTLQGFNWSQVSDLIEGKATLAQGITTAEELANTFLDGATILGIPFAGTAATFIPMAENLITFAESFIPNANNVNVVNPTSDNGVGTRPTAAS